MKRHGKCAKYTMHHTASKIEKVWKTVNRVLASKLEYRIKHLNKKQKESLVKNEINIGEIFSNDINEKLYEDITIYMENKKYFVV